MGGTIKRADGSFWSRNFWVFHWLMDTMAEATRDAELAAHLREIEDNNFGYLGLDELTEEGSGARQSGSSSTSCRIGSRARG